MAFICIVPNLGLAGNNGTLSSRNNRYQLESSLEPRILNLFGNLIDDEYFHYRIITYNYPIKYDPNANFFLYLKTEKITRNCKKLDEGKYLMLIKC